MGIAWGVVSQEDIAELNAHETGEHSTPMDTTARNRSDHGFKPVTMGWFKNRKRIRIQISHFLLRRALHQTIFSIRGDTMEIRELTSKDEWLDVFPLMNQLRDGLDEESYLDYMRMMTADGYRLFAGEVDGEVVALAGVGIQVNMYYGRHLWVYELVTHRDNRSQGYGSIFLEFLEGWATERDCELIALSSGLQREDAHRFYEERAGMEPASYVYKKPI